MTSTTGDPFAKPTTGSHAAPPPPPPPGPPTAAPPRRGVPMVVRHVLGAIAALVVTPVGIMVLDYGAARYHRERLLRFQDAETGVELATMAAGLFLLMLVAASTRVSGLGPLLAGVVWGVVPFVWFMADLRSFYDFSRDLPSTHFWFGSPAYLFPLVAALLIGAGIGGRWLRRKA